MPVTAQLNISKNQKEIIKAILYFDVFKYPLSKTELYENSAIHISKEMFLEELNVLVKNKVLKTHGEFVLHPERTENDLNRRLAGNKGADKIMPKAVHYSRKIASFPFVEGVCLSGGLSKNYYDEKGDIDFFIITQPNRVWICRTFLIIAYKLLPKHLKKYWCTNYFISSDNLSIPDVNVFTGTEIAYLIPTINYTLYKNLINHNRWYKNNFPNKNEATDLFCTEKKNVWYKKGIETLFNGKTGDWLDSKLLSYTLKRWRKKYPEMKSEDFELQFRSRKNVCKRHTFGFQNKVLTEWEAKTKLFEEQFSVKLV